MWSPVRRRSWPRWARSSTSTRSPSRTATTSASSDPRSRSTRATCCWSPTPPSRARTASTSSCTSWTWSPGRTSWVSFHAGKPIDAESVARRVKAHPELAREGAGFLLYVVLDELVDSFFPTLDGIGERVEDLEEVVFAGSSDVQNQIFALR